MTNFNSSVKPKETFIVEVCANLNANCGDYEAIYVGYVKLPEKEQRGRNFERKSYYDLKPLKFKSTITIVPPKLRIEDIDETCFNFDLSSGELIDDNHQIMMERKYISQLALINDYSTPIRFKLNIDEPFEFDDFSKSNSMISLLPKKKLQIGVVCNLRKSFIEQVSDNKKELESIQRHLRIEYLGGFSQVVSISSRIWLPRIQVDCNTIDFGIVLVGQTCTKQFVIKNVSRSTVIWRLEFDEDEIFKIDVTEGTLISDKTFYKRTEQLISVSFTAKHSELYEKEIFIKVGLMDQLISINLIGQGSYDEQDEVINE